MPDYPKVSETTKVVVDLSRVQTFTIPNGANGSAVDPVDFEGNFESFIVRCPDAGGIPAITTMGAQVGMTDADTLMALHAADGGAAWASNNLPTSGTLHFHFTGVIGARRIRFVLSQNTTAQVVLQVYGWNRGS